MVGSAAGLGDTPLMICGDLQHGPRRQSRHLDFALSQGWLTDLGQTHNLLEQLNPCTPMSKEIQRRAWTLHWSTRPSARQWETSRWCSGISYPNTKGSKPP